MLQSVVYAAWRPLRGKTAVCQVKLSCCIVVKPYKIKQANSSQLSRLQFSPEGKSNRITCDGIIVKLT